MQPSEAERQKQIAKELIVTWELTGTPPLSQIALRALVNTVSRYPDEIIGQAILRVRRAATGRVTAGHVLATLEAAEDRPTAEEAWATAITAQDARETLVWTVETQQAFSLAQPVLSAGDTVGARMAFRDCYARLVEESRRQGTALRWTVRPGLDAGRRMEAIRRAKREGLLTEEQARQYLPSPETSRTQKLALLPSRYARRQGEFTNPWKGIKKAIQSATDSRKPLSVDDKNCGGSREDKHENIA